MNNHWQQLTQFLWDCHWLKHHVFKHSHAASVGFSAASYNSMEPEQTTPEDRERQRQILDATIESILPRDCLHWLHIIREMSLVQTDMPKNACSRLREPLAAVARFTPPWLHFFVISAKSKWHLKGTFLHYQHHNFLQIAYSSSGNHYIENLRTCCINWYEL